MEKVSAPGLGATKNLISAARKEEREGEVCTRGDVTHRSMGKKKKLVPVLHPAESASLNERATQTAVRLTMTEHGSSLAASKHLCKFERQLMWKREREEIL